MLTKQIYYHITKDKNANSIFLVKEKQFYDCDKVDNEKKTILRLGELQHNSYIFSKFNNKMIIDNYPNNFIMKYETFSTTKNLNKEVKTSYTCLCYEECDHESDVRYKKWLNPNVKVIYYKYNDKGKIVINEKNMSILNNINKKIYEHFKANHYFLNNFYGKNNLFCDKTEHNVAEKEDTQTSDNDFYTDYSDNDVCTEYSDDD